MTRQLPRIRSDTTAKQNWQARMQSCTANISHAIVRTLVLYGIGIGVKSNFALWLIQSLRAGKRIRVVEDQIGNPTYVGDLAAAIVKIFELCRQGIYHVAGSENISRYEFALRTAQVFNLDASLIERIKTSDLNQAAPRPMQSGFILDKAEKELGIRFHNATEGLLMLKQELEEHKN